MPALLGAETTELRSLRAQARRRAMRSPPPPPGPVLPPSTGCSHGPLRSFPACSHGPSAPKASKRPTIKRLTCERASRVPPPAPPCSCTLYAGRGQPRGAGIWHGAHWDQGPGPHQVPGPRSCGRRTSRRVDCPRPASRTAHQISVRMRSSIECRDTRARSSNLGGTCRVRGSVASGASASVEVRGAWCVCPATAHCHCALPPCTDGPSPSTIML